MTIQGWSLSAGAALAGLLWGAAAASAADAIAQPALQPDDSWTYVNTTERRPNVWHQTRSESRIVRASGAMVLLRVAEVGSPNPPAELMLNADWSRFRSIDGKETLTYKPFAFPLAVGKAWDLKYTDDHPSNNAHKSEQRQLHYKVVGWEDVAVPAGKFKALKIEADGEWNATVAPKTGAVVATQSGADGTTAVAQTQNVQAREVGGRLYEAIWYVPEVKRAVKSIEENYDTNGVRNERITVELETYKPAATSAAAGAPTG